MKKRLLLAVMLCLTALLLVGCAETPDSRTVFVAETDSYTEYDIVYYRHNSAYDGNVITKFVDETHYDKAAGWTLEDVETMPEAAYPGFDSMDFTSSSVTDEGDYYCCICEFDDLDKLANLEVLRENDALFTSQEGSDSDALVDADYFIRSIQFNITRPSTKLTEEEVAKLGLHYDAAQG